MCAVHIEFFFIWVSARTSVLACICVCCVCLFYSHQFFYEIESSWIKLNRVHNTNKWVESVKQCKILPMGLLIFRWSRQKSLLFIEKSPFLFHQQPIYRSSYVLFPFFLFIGFFSKFPCNFLLCQIFSIYCVNFHNFTERKKIKQTMNRVNKIITKTKIEIHNCFFLCAWHRWYEMCCLCISVYSVCESTVYIFIPGNFVTKN